MFFNKILFEMFSEEIKLLLKVDTIRFYGMSHLSARFIIPRRYESLVFDVKNSVRPTFTASVFSKFLPSKKRVMDHIDCNLKAQDEGYLLAVVAVRFLSVPDFFPGCSYSMGSCIVQRNENTISTSRPFGTNS